MPADHTGAEGIALLSIRCTGWLKSFQVKAAIQQVLLKSCWVASIHLKALAMLGINTHQASTVGSSDCPNPHQLELVQAAIKDRSTFMWQDKPAACGLVGCFELVGWPACSGNQTIHRQQSCLATWHDKCAYSTQSDAAANSEAGRGPQRYPHSCPNCSKTCRDQHSCRPSPRSAAR